MQNITAARCFLQQKNNGEERFVSVEHHDSLDVFFVNSTLVLRHFQWWSELMKVYWEWRLLWFWNAPFLQGPPNRDRSFQFNGRYVHPRKRRQHSWSSMTSAIRIPMVDCRCMDDCPPFEFAWIFNGPPFWRNVGKIDQIFQLLFFRGHLYTCSPQQLRYLTFGKEESSSTQNCPFDGLC